MAFQRLKMLAAFKRTTVLTGGGLFIRQALNFYASDNEVETIEKPSDPITFPSSVQKLSHEFLIRQSCSISSESASTLQTHLVEAFTDVINEYSNQIGELISIYENSVTALTEEGAERVSQLKQLCNENKKLINDMNMLFHFVKKLMEANAEVCFLAGAEFSSTQASERLYSAQKTVSDLYDKSKLMELELAKAQQSHIDKTGRVLKNFNFSSDEDNSTKDKNEESGDSENLS